jgi:hypothetical protein
VTTGGCQAVVGIVSLAVFSCAGKITGMESTRLPSLTNAGEYVEVPRWIPNSTDYRHLSGKRVFAEIGGKGRSLQVGRLQVYGPNSAGRFAVDLTFRWPENDASFAGYVYHLSLAQLERIVPVQHPQHEYEYLGVLNADHPFTTSFQS